MSCPDAVLQEHIDAVIRRALADKRIVGTVVMIARNGELLYQNAAGWADREEQRPMELDNIFRHASVTKPLVMVAALRVLEQGGIALADAITQFLPDFRPQYENRTPVIQIRHLLSHTAGLSYRFLESYQSDYYKLDISDGLDLRDFSLDENLRRLAQASLVFAPGTAWRYSLAIDVLGAVLEKATGKPLERLVEELVCKPLKMKDTRFVIVDPSQRSRVATAYYNADPEPRKLQDNEEVPRGDGGFVRFAPSRIFHTDAFASGGAGMAGTASDFVRFLEAVRNHDEQLLRTETWQLAMTDHVGPEAETQGPGWGFGFGWAILSDPIRAKSPQSKGTLGWSGAYGHNWFVDPISKLSVVAFTNTLFEGMWGRFPTELRDAIYQ